VKPPHIRFSAPSPEIRARPVDGHNDAVARLGEGRKKRSSGGAHERGGFQNSDGCGGARGERRVRALILGPLFTTGLASSVACTHGRFRQGRFELYHRAPTP